MRKILAVSRDGAGVAYGLKAGAAEADGGVGVAELLGVSVGGTVGTGVGDGVGAGPGVGAYVSGAFGNSNS
jgi:hypothetical protein